MYSELIIQFLVKWYKSRDVRSLAIKGGALFSLPLLAFAFVIWGYTTSNNTVYATCIKIVDDVLKADGEDEIAAASQNAEDLHVPLERILQLGKSNDRVVFVVATQLARQGRVSEAWRRMRSIAPAGEKGFPPAHDWLARMWLANGGSVIAEDLAALWNDLAIAESSMASLPPELTREYVKHLIQIGESKKALGILRTRTKIEPRLNTVLVELASRMGKKKEAEEAAALVRKAIESEYEGREKDEAYYLRMFDFERFVRSVEELSALVLEGVNAFPQSDRLRRVHAELSLLKPVEEGVLEDGSSVLGGDRMARIRRAFEIDPMSPTVLTMIAQEVAVGTKIPAEFREALRKSLQEGTAPSEAMFVIANLMLATGKSGGAEGAIPLFAAVARDGRMSAAAVNNLAYALLQLDEPNVEGALELLDRVVGAPGLPATSRASIYDTQGDARKMQGDETGAIESYENALKLVSTKINTRRKLSALYENLGMTDLAKGQLRRIKELENEREKAAGSSR